MYKGTSSLPIN